MHLKWEMDSVVHPSLTQEPGIVHIINPDFNAEVFDIWLTSNFMAELNNHEMHDEMARQHYERYHI